MEHHTIHLSASEKAFLWVNYMADSMAVCCLGYFIEKCEDPEIKEVFTYALKISELHTELISDIFTKEQLPIPMGFTNEDVYYEAPRLFSDEFVLLYIHHMANMGLTYYAKALSMTARIDVHEYFRECMTSSTELNSRTKKLLLSKGLYVRPPYIPDQSKPEMIEEIGYLKGFLGQQRALNAIEVSNMFFNLQTIEVVKTFVTAFSKLVKSKDVKDLLIRGKELSLKSSEVFHEIMNKEELSSATPWYTYISDTKTSPFSDKLIMFHFSLLIGGGIEQYGFSLATSLRRDIGARYAQLITEMMTFSDDGMNLMIKNKWMEQPPMASS